jgi:hypothetical protein
MKKSSDDVVRERFKALAYEKDARSCGLHEDAAELYDEAGKYRQKSGEPLKAWEDFVLAERVYEHLADSFSAQNIQNLVPYFLAKAMKEKKAVRAIEAKSRLGLLLKLSEGLIKTPDSIKATASILGILVSLSFFSTNITGNVIANLTKQDVSLMGALILLIGILFGVSYFRFRMKKKS